MTRAYRVPLTAPGRPGASLLVTADSPDDADSIATARLWALMLDWPHDATLGATRVDRSQQPQHVEA